MPFDVPFDTVPNVVVWISGLHVYRSRNTNLDFFVNRADITKEGFILRIGGFQNASHISAFKATWVAYLPGRGIVSGRSKISDFRPADSPQLHDGGYVQFPTDTNTRFQTAPRVMLGISGLSFGKSANVRVRTHVQEVTSTGLYWQANSWYDSKMLDLAVSYIAFTAEE